MPTVWWWGCWLLGSGTATLAEVVVTVKPAVARSRMLAAGASAWRPATPSLVAIMMSEQVL